MPRRLRPTAPTATGAVLVGDPGRALLLAQELLEQPKMSNHARGLWGYYGTTPAGGPLTIQSTGIGGPSAALVLADLAKLGVQRAVRVGTCVGLDGNGKLGELVVVREAIAAGGSVAALGARAGETVAPDPGLTGRLLDEAGANARAASVTSIDAHPGESPQGPGDGFADMQTAPLLVRARTLRIAAAAVLIVAENGGGQLDKEELEPLEREAGRAASRAILSG